MFNPLITKPKTTIGFNPLILNISESKKRYLYAYGTQIVPFTALGTAAPSFQSNRILFSSSIDSGQARTTDSINIISYTKATIYWLGSVDPGARTQFILKTTSGVEVVKILRTDSYSLVRESIDLTSSTVKNNISYPDFRLEVDRRGDFSSAVASASVFEIYLE